ncbi:ATP-binding cassette domain-containing protein [Staphylococcus epidermidis]|uniref:ATP-binding cassette domain-containing protein n=1 Tax=Staphylococcus epidermidis TaxID=1282 RepID=UPI0009AFF8A9
MYRLKKGDLLGLLGKEGVVKSTLMNIITGLTHKISGKYVLNINNSKVKQTEISVLPDYSSFYENLIRLDHLKYFRRSFQ